VAVDPKDEKHDAEFECMFYPDHLLSILKKCDNFFYNENAIMFVVGGYSHMIGMRKKD